MGKDQCGRKLYPTLQMTIAVGGQALDVLGLMSVDISVQDTRLRQDVLLVRNLCQHVILDWDFMMAYGAVEDCTKGTTVLQHVGVNMRLL